MSLLNMEPSPTTTIINNHTTNTYTAYDVKCFNHRVRTIVTANPTVVTTWINRFRSSNNPLTTTIVGLDTEWFNPIATLQLCVGPDCLIYQLMHSPFTPSALRDFLEDPRWKFSGVGIAGDYKKLLNDYDLRLSCMVDVSKVAAEMGMVRVGAGLKTVVKAVLGWEMEKAKEITMSGWNKEVLDERQVLYACMDAFVSYHIGKKLIGKDCAFNDGIDDKDFGEKEISI